MASAVVVPLLPAIRLNKVLFATDCSTGSNAAIPLVRLIADHYGSEILALRVVPPPQYPLVPPDVVATLADAQRLDARRELDAVLQSLAVEKSKALVETGRPVVEISRVVDELGVDLVVLGTHGRTGLKRLLLGSVAESLFRGLSCPVLTVGQHLAHRFLNIDRLQNILFPTDLSDESRAVFPYLAALGQEYGAKMTLLHVVPDEVGHNPDMKVLTSPLVTRMKQMFGRQISPKCEVEYLIDSGETSERILLQARAREIDLIGFGLRKLPEAITHFRNTVAYRVIVEAGCPVLSVRGTR